MQESNFPKAICIVGGDGTGKTAHALRIIEELRSKGKKCCYVWFGQPYLLANPFMFICNRLGYTMNHRLPSGMICQEHQYYKNKALAFIWPWIQLIDLSVLVFIRVYLPVWQGTMVVCDRFVPDTLVEVMTDTDDPKLASKTAGKMFLALKPSFASIIRLDASSQTAFYRKNDVPDVSILRVKRCNYEVVSKQFNLRTVKTENSFEVVHRNIMKMVDCGYNHEK